jgi:hypothetical protein
MGEPMKNVVGTDDSGEPKTVDLTYRELIVNALHTFDEDERVGAEQKARIYAICAKLYSKGKQVDLTSEELALIKERASRLTILGYGRICDWVEGNKHDLDDIDDADAK